MEPLFGTQAALLARLRLTGMCKAQGSTIAIIDDCILQAHLDMQTAFGSPQLVIYTAIVPNSPPSVDADYTYYRLRSLEDKLVEKCLLWKLVQVFMEGGSDIGEYFDKEYPYRNMDAATLQGKYNRLCREIANSYEGLATREDFAAAGTITTADLGPECTAPFVQGLGADLSPSVCGGEARSLWCPH